jgi:S1-C subfamily serine protease
MEGSSLRRVVKDFFKLFLLFSIFSFSSPAENFVVPNAVVQIFTYEQFCNPALPWLLSPLNGFSGSGFVLEENLLLTNAHVVSRAKYIEVKKQNQSHRYFATVKWISHVSDLAILEMQSSSFYDDMTPLKLGGIPLLDSVVKAVGFPMGGEKLSVTNGIVSRIDRIIYSHSEVDEHLVIQTDAALNMGNSGGPVLQDNAVVGMAFQGLGAGDNIGYMIPTTLIRHFLKDIKDGHVDGIPELGVTFSDLPPAVRQAFRFPDVKSGVLINAVHPQGPTSSILKKNDILTAINGCPISDDGSITLDGLRVAFYEVVERSQMKDSISLEWYRDGRENKQMVLLTKIPLPLDVGMTFEKNTQYVIEGGLVFVKLNGEYMHAFGKDWWVQVPHPFRLLYYYQTQFNKDPQRKYYVVLSAILKDSMNIQAVPFQHQILETINGVPIRCLEDVKTSFAAPGGAFHILRFIENSSPLILSTAKVKKTGPELLKTYSVPASSFLNTEKSR